MKNQSHLQSSSANLRAASPKFILTGLISAAAGLVLAATGSAQNNGVSQFSMFIDGAFSNGVGTGEWSDVTPAFFFSSPGVSATPLPGPAGANSQLFAALGHPVGSTDLSLHLLYDFVPRTNPFVTAGEIFASITFPITLPGRPTGDKQNVSVLFQGASHSALKGSGGVAFSFFDVFVDLDSDGVSDGTPQQLGLNLIGAAGFGPSQLSSIDHLIIELGVELRIPQGFGAQGGPLPGNGINPATGLYDPAPAFWGAAGSADGSGASTFGDDPLQPASSASFTINPNGSTTVTPTPEPTSAVLLIGTLGVLAARRRRATGAA